MGLVTELADRGGSLERATEFARQLAALPQEPIRATKRALNQWFRLGLTTAFDVALAAEFSNFGTPATATHIKNFLAQQSKIGQ